MYTVYSTLEPQGRGKLWKVNRRLLAGLTFDVRGPAGRDQAHNASYPGLLTVGRHPAGSYQSLMYAMCWTETGACNREVFLHPTNPFFYCLITFIGLILATPNWIPVYCKKAGMNSVCQGPVQLGREAGTLESGTRALVREADDWLGTVIRYLPSQQIQFIYTLYTASCRM